MKKCTQCKVIKELSDFYKHNSCKYGVRSECKVCHNKRSKKYIETKRGLISKIYSAQKNRSKKRQHRAPEYTKKSLIEWLYSQELFHKLFEEWKQSGYKNHLIPSIDRKNDDIHYCLNNIQIMTWRENNNKGKKCSEMPVNQYTKDGKMIACFISMNDAGRITGVSIPHISQCCNKIRNSAGGYIWKLRSEI